MTQAAISVQNVRHSYGAREALAGVSFDVPQGETLALLGPNGSGKTTLFRLVSTLSPLQAGAIRVAGCDVAGDPAGVRAVLGVVFQAPSLDKKLRVVENLRCHAALYGLTGALREERIRRELARFQVEDRASDFVERLSGGLARRVELAQTMLHEPRVLLLDEPSTGLDPAARSDLWTRLDEARARGVTIAVTTHLLEEAERADRIAILDRGRLVALDTPTALRASVGGDALSLRSKDPEALAREVRERFGAAARVVAGVVRVEHADAMGLAARLYQELRDRIDEASVHRPTLEDVFLARTGRRFDHVAEAPGV